MKFKSTLFSTILTIVFMFVYAMSISAASGDWYSNWGVDLNGVSQVGTTYNSISSSTVTLRVQNGDYSTVGVKTVGVTKDQTIEHTCWGAPFTARRGVVLISGLHTPWFND